jgi:hypothetical protein
MPSKKAREQTHGVSLAIPPLIQPLEHITERERAGAGPGELAAVLAFAAHVFGIVVRR